MTDNDGRGAMRAAQRKENGVQGWTVRDIEEIDAWQISSWRYPEPYSLYDASPDDIDWMLDPTNGYSVVVNGDNALIGFCCFGHDARVPGGNYDTDAIDWGAGMRPDLTGKGQGLSFMRLVCDEARRRWPRVPLRTTVASFNERSQHVVRKLGFGEVEIFRNPANREFVIFIGA